MGKAQGKEINMQLESQHAHADLIAEVRRQLEIAEKTRAQGPKKTARHSTKAAAVEDTATLNRAFQVSDFPSIKLTPLMTFLTTPLYANK